MKHALSQIDTVRRRAFCPACGRVVPIIRNGHGGWRCAEQSRARHRRYSDRGGCREHLKHRRPSCEWCGFMPAVVAGRPVLGQLEVHHRDGDRTNNDPANLVTLCGHCHACVHAADRLRGPVRLGEHIKIMLRVIGEAGRRAA